MLDDNDFVNSATYDLSAAREDLLQDYAEVVLLLRSRYRGVRGSCSKAGMYPLVWDGSHLRVVTFSGEEPSYDAVPTDVLANATTNLMRLVEHLEERLQSSLADAREAKPVVAAVRDHLTLLVLE